MTSIQESPRRPLPDALGTQVESLAGVFHPHAIEIQDFSHYAVLIDVRSAAEFDDDHMPGAVRLGPERVASLRTITGAPARAPAGVGDLPLELADLVASIKLDQALLVYCGQGGRDSLVVAKALRGCGWTVDVLPGGWINYRRWVEAGLEVLPRLIAFRTVSAALSGETALVLAGLSTVGEQVLDLEGLAGWQVRGLGSVSRTQPAQAWFDSQLLRALRRFDPRRPVWVGEMALQMGSLRLPGALLHAVASSPIANLECSHAERLTHWRQGRDLFEASVEEILSRRSRVSGDVQKALAVDEAGPCEVGAIEGMVEDCERRWQSQRSPADVSRRRLPPLRIESLAPDRLQTAIDAWLRAASATALD